METKNKKNLQNQKSFNGNKAETINFIRESINNSRSVVKDISRDRKNIPETNTMPKKGGNFVSTYYTAFIVE